VDSEAEADFNNDHDKEPKVKEVASKGKKIPVLLASILKELLIKKLVMSYVFAKFR